MVCAHGGKTGLTLDEVRAALAATGTTWSPNGELLFAQGRTALVIEIDELIDTHGAGKHAMDLV